MEYKLISCWNKVVKKFDTIFVHGDFALCPKEKIKEILSNLNGHKVLIMGNHDRHKSVKVWLEIGFNEVSKYPIIVEDDYIFSHEPVILESESKFKNIYGHTHSKGFNDDKSFCVSIEKIEYKPINFDIIKDYFKGVKS